MLAGACPRRVLPSSGSGSLDLRSAAIGLVLYFVCAVTAHLRVRDRQIGGAVVFLLLAAAALTTDIAYHNRW